LIDRARSAMGWNAHQQTSVHGEQSPQDLAIISWFEICHDAGMRLEQYLPCYRAAQARKTELLRQGQQLTMVTPHDLVAELEQVRRMNVELDGVKMLPENATHACLRCFGTGFERMPNGAVKPNCDHIPMTEEEEAAIREHRVADAEFVKGTAEFMREALSKIGNPKPPAEPKKDTRGTRLVCGVCGRKVWTVFGFIVGGVCGELLNRGEYDDLADMKFCDGVFAAKS
jgi:hypothetical protein